MSYDPQPTPGALTTLAALRLHLRLDDTQFDVELCPAIDQASAAVASFCRRTFALGEHQEVVCIARPARSVFVHRWPVVAVADADLVAGRANGEIRFADGRLFAPGDHVISYTAGYVLPGNAGANLPADIERAALLTATAYYNGRSRDPLVKSERVKVEGVEEVQTTWGLPTTGLPPEAQALLTPWRRTVL